MANTELLQAIDKAISLNPSIQVDLVNLINGKLKSQGLKLAYEPKVTHVTKRKTEETKPEAQAKGRRRGRPKEGEQTHGEAILAALKEMGGGNSKELEEKLTQMGHPIATATMHTTLGALMRDGKVSAEGKKRSYIYSIANAE